jgi:hypothetical protein
MLYHAKFLTKDLTGKTVEALASDSIFPLDGRGTFNTMKLKTFTQLYRLRNVQSEYIGFRIYKKGFSLGTIEFKTREELERSASYPSKELIDFIDRKKESNNYFDETDMSDPRNYDDSQHFFEETHVSEPRNYDDSQPVGPDGMNDAERQTLDEQNLEAAQTHDQCPKCSSENMFGLGYELLGEEVTQDYQCGECDCKFMQTFNLSGCTIKGDE